MESYWLNSQILKDIQDLAPHISKKQSFQLVFTGDAGISKHDAIDFYLAGFGGEKFILNQLDFSFEEFSSNAFLIGSYQYYVKQHPLFEQFLQRFPKKQQRYIQQKLAEIDSNLDKKDDWYLEIYREFLTFASDGHSFFIVLENIDCMTQPDFENLQKFLLHFSHLPIQILYSRDADAAVTRTIPGAKEIVLTKLSIQAMEKAIQKSLRTAVLNARLITNHCYLKTGGIPLKVSLLLHSVYKFILERQPAELIDLKKLQKLKVPESWEDIFSLYYHMEEPIARKILTIIALVDEPFCQEDLVFLLSKARLPASVINKWVSIGFLKYFQHEGEKCVVVEPLHFRKWVKKMIPAEELAEVLKNIAQFQLAGKFKRAYLLSDILHRIGENQTAMMLAENEGYYFHHHNKDFQAADRLYFFTRMAENSECCSSRMPSVYEQLADIYVQLGSYENAFEMLKKYHATFSPVDLERNDQSKMNWLKVNLKIAKVLIEMDSFQEARYLIRETRVKQNCDNQILAQCYELLGDIEVNLAHRSQALLYYKKALVFYQKAGSSSELYPLYLKCKGLVKENLKRELRTIREFDSAMDKTTAEKEFQVILLHDEISLLLQSRALSRILQKCRRLEKRLNDIYEPRLNIQLAFFFSEIYAHRGEWSFVLKHLTKASKERYAQQHPELQVQILLQLALVYKEQAQYGAAVKMLNTAQEMAIENGYLNPLYEIKLHFGHIYLLVHNLLKSFELLKEVQQWADAHHQNHLSFLVRLYLSYYELNQKRMEKSRRMLSEAKRILNQNFSEIDYLNYLFYLAIWLINQNRPTAALWVVQRLMAKSEGIPRYRLSGYYLQGLAECKRKNFTASKSYLQKTLVSAARWDFPYIKYLALCALARQSAQVEDQKATRRQYQKTCGYIKYLAENMGDDILSTQFLESQSHEDILSFCAK